MEFRPSTITTRTNHILTITGGDTYVGYCIAMHFLRESERDGRDRHSKCRIRVLCRHEKDCDELRDMGAEIIETDYEERKSLRYAFSDCDHVVFVPDTTRNRVRHGERVIEAMERADVRNVIMISMVGAETEDGDLRNMREFRKLEKYLEGMFTRGKWCIFRLNFLQQFFLLWAPMIENKRVLKMSTGHEGRFAPINLNDVCRATYVTITRHHREGDHGRHGDDGCDRDRSHQRSSQEFRWVPLDERHHRRVYRLTGPDALDGDEIARMLGDAIGEREVKFEDLSRFEMRKELERLRDGEKHSRHEEMQRGKCEEGQQSGLTAAVGAAERRNDDKSDRDRDRRDRDDRDGGRDRNGGRDRDNGRDCDRGPTKRHLTETKIETLLDYFEYVKMGEADFTSGDLRDIMDEEPEPLEKFFRKHRDEFRGRSRN